MPPTLRTGRLLLLPVQDDDLPALHAHWNDPRVGRYLWDANPVPASTVADLIARSHHTFQTAGWGLWTLRPAPAAPFIGVCGLVPFQHGPGVELLYSLAPTHWSKGLATEAATAVLTHAFDTLGLPPSSPPPTTPTRPPSASSPASAPLPPPASRSAPTPTPASPSDLPTTRVCSLEAPVAQWIEQRTSNP
jgi:hypothetical protein